MNIVWAISVDNWYVLYQDREKWPNMCAVAVDEVAQCMERSTCAANRASQKSFSL